LTLKNAIRWFEKKRIILMTDSRKKLRNLADGFVIPAGSQVVLLETKAAMVSKGQTSGRFKKAGTVGVVVNCPPHNGLPYLVRFADESELEIPFDQLTLRRQEIENILKDVDQEDFTPYIIYRCKVGSKAFGLDNEQSDDDLRGIFLPPANRHWSLYKRPEQIEIKTERDDEVYWELEKFLKLALKANPNILETLWTPIVLHCNAIGEKIRINRKAFLSKHLYKTYSGYVLSQFRRMKNSFEKTGKYKNKHAMHLVRLLYSGIEAMKTGEIVVNVSEHRDQLLKIRNGEFSFEEIRQCALELDRSFQKAFEQTDLPEQPDFELVDRMLIEARRTMVK